MSLSDVIKNSFAYFRETKEPLTPENYQEVFCSEAKKLGLNTPDCTRVEATIKKLHPSLQKKAAEYRVRTIGELLSFLVTNANLKTPAQATDQSRQEELIRHLLHAIKKLPFGELSGNATRSLGRDMSNKIIVDDECNKWQKIAFDLNIPADQKIIENQKVTIESDHRYIDSSDFVIILFEIDGFEKLVENFGKDSGKTILKIVTQTIKQITEKSIEIKTINKTIELTLKTPFLKEALEFTDEILQAIKKKKFLYEKTTFSVTLSAGVAQKSRIDTTDIVADQAKEFLQIAKQSGGDRLKSYE